MEDGVEEVTDGETEARVGRVMAAANQKLRPLGFEIRRQVSEEDGTKYIGIANLKNDQFSRVATFYKEGELIYLKKIVELIIKSKTVGEITREEALEARKELKTTAPPPEASQVDQGHDPDDQPSQPGSTKVKLSMEQTEAALQGFVRDKWLEERDGNVTLGPRCFLELKVFIEAEYGQDGEGLIAECTMCNDMGARCSNEKCETRMHTHCARRWFHGKAVKKCPTCTLDFLI